MLSLPRTRTLRRPHSRHGLAAGAAALLVTVVLTVGGAPAPSGWGRGPEASVASGRPAALPRGAAGVSGLVQDQATSFGIARWGA
jgi:hypothetical protein